jgi:xanthine dehydrogenase YagS FAD-binding subunit
LKGVEDVLTGESINEELATMAGSSASRGAKALNFNHFKIPLMENLVKRAIRNA